MPVYLNRIKRRNTKVYTTGLSPDYHRTKATDTHSIKQVNETMAKPSEWTNQGAVRPSCYDKSYFYPSLVFLATGKPP